MCRRRCCSARSACRLELPALMLLRSRLSHRRAQANSSPRIARPTGITTIAGPGAIIMTMPIARTVRPMTSTAIRRTRPTVRLIVFIDSDYSFGVASRLSCVRFRGDFEVRPLTKQRQADIETSFFGLLTVALTNGHNDTAIGFNSVTCVDLRSCRARADD